MQVIDTLHRCAQHRRARASASQRAPGSTNMRRTLEGSRGHDNILGQYLITTTLNFPNPFPVPIKCKWIIEV